MVSSDTTAAGQTVTSTYTSTYTNTNTGAAFTDAAPGNPARAGQLELFASLRGGGLRLTV